MQMLGQGRMRWAGLAVLLCGMAAAWGQPTAPVSVEVKDQTGFVISTATIQVSPQGSLPPRVAADADGRVVLPLDKGEYDLRVFARGFAETEEHISVAGPMTIPVVLNVGAVASGFPVTPDPRDEIPTDRPAIAAMIQSAPARAPAPAPGYTPVTVAVTDASGAGVPGAEIRLTPGSPAGDRLITDEHGRVQLGVPAGEYRLHVAAQGFSTAEQSLVVADKPQTVTVTLVPSVPSEGGTSVAPGPAPLQPGAVALESTVETPHAASEQQPAAGTVLTIIGTGGLRGIFTPQTLKEYPHQTVTIFDHHTNANETYSGVPLMDLLAKLGVAHGKDLMGKALGQYVVATGSDGYKSVVALGEVDPEFHPGMVLIADTMDGKPLDKAGPFRLVVTEDKRPARSVRNLVKVELRSAE
jgi:hypothetical protein